jgi:hypothetical protein
MWIVLVRHLENVMYSYNRSSKSMFHHRIPELARGAHAVTKFLRSSAMPSVAALLFSLSSAHATLLTTDPGTGVTTTFTDTGNNRSGNPGPVTLDGFSVTGNPQVTWGNAPYGIAPNGSWNSFSWIATNNGSGSITFDLGGAYGLVGAFLNYSPGVGSDPTITALNSSMDVIASYDLAVDDPINTPGGTNEGDWVGISDSSDDIAYLEISGSYILAHSVEVGGSRIGPGPGTRLARTIW